jgi:hypothetical protein
LPQCGHRPPYKQNAASLLMKGWRRISALQ